MGLLTPHTKLIIKRYPELDQLPAYVELSSMFAPKSIPELFPETKGQICFVYAYATYPMVPSVINPPIAEPIIISLIYPSYASSLLSPFSGIDANIKFEYIINLQGDMPFFDPKTIADVARELDKDPDADIATMAALIDDVDDITDPNVVKVVFAKNHHALYFSSSPIPYSMSDAQTDYYYHVGVYAYRRKAMENNMIIRVGISKEIPSSVDVPEDLKYAREHARKL